jgi:hypothetical protein
VRRLVLVAAASLLLAVPASQAGKPSFSFRASAAAKVTAGATAVVLDVRSSEAADVTATLYRSGRKLETWRTSVATGHSRLRLPLRASSRRIGRYALLVSAHAEPETVFRTLRFRIG